MKKFETNILLLSVVFCWAAAYVFIETLTARISSFGYLTLVNGIAAILLVVTFLPKFRYVTKKELLHSALLGLIMTGVLLAEYAGIERTNSSTASLLASLDIVVVPLLLLFLGRRPKRHQVAGIVLILLGTVLTRGLANGGNHAAGIFFMALDGVLMAFYNVFSNRFCEEDDPLLLAALQLCFMTLISLAFWHREDPRVFFGVDYTVEVLSAVLLLGVFSKAFAYVALMYGERYADPIDVVIIFALEPVITMIFGAVFPNTFGGAETELTLKGLICAVIIVLGSCVAGIDQEELRILRARLKRKGGENAVTEALFSAVSETETEVPSVPVSETETEISSSPGTGWNRWQAFLLTFAVFLIFGVCFKFMVLIRAYTEIRPVDSIPMLAGLMCGLPGALACALANLAADCFGTLTRSSVLGMAVNFLLAFLPFRLWKLWGTGRPNVHSRRNLRTFLFLILANALTASWFLGFGICFFFGRWIPKLMRYVFMNSMVFPILFGLPVFIMLTCPDVNKIPAPPRPWILPFSEAVRRRMFLGYFLIILGICGTVAAGISPETVGNAPFLAASVPAALLLAVSLL